MSSLSKLKLLFRQNLKRPDVPTRLSLLDFTTLSAFNRIQTTSDEVLGGFSTVNFEPYRIKSIPTDPSIPKDPNTTSLDHKLVGHFHGNLNTTLPPSRPKVVKSGWCMMKTKNRHMDPNYQYKPFYWSLKFTNTWWDFSPFVVLYLRVCNLTPSRKFMVNIQTDTMSRTDLYQHRLFTDAPIDVGDGTTAPVWQDVFIQLNEFVLTNRGTIQVQHQDEFEKERIKSVGLSIADNVNGEFSMLVEKVECLGGYDYVTKLQEARNKQSYLLHGKEETKMIE